MNYDWNFSRLAPYGEAFLRGTGATLAITFLAIVFGTGLGILLGMALRSRRIRLFYPMLDIVRAVPPLVLLLFLYFFITPQVVGVVLSPFLVAVIAFSINVAAFVADIVRTSLEEVPRGIIDAGRALGMSKRQLDRYVIFPRAFRQAFPALLVLYIGTLKMTSLASVINVREVVYAAQTVVADISRSLEAWVVVAAIYVAIVVPLTILARRVEVWATRGREPNVLRLHEDF